MRHSNLIILALAGVAAFSQSGCQFLPYSLQPEQLRKLNRQPAMDVRFQSPPDLEQVTAEEAAIELVAH